MVKTYKVITAKNEKEIEDMINELVADGWEVDKFGYAIRLKLGETSSPKEYECVQVGHHKDVGKQIMQWQKNGWRLHMYSCAQVSVGADAYHYLLFERGE